MKKHNLERLVLFDYLLMECDHKEAMPGETHWHVCHAGTGDSICVTSHQFEATCIAYGLALFERISVSEQLQILGESTAAEPAIEVITTDELLAWLRSSTKHED